VENGHIQGQFVQATDGYAVASTFRLRYNGDMDPEYLVHMELADEFMQAARICLEQNLFNAAASRAYYAVVHAGIAALAFHTELTAEYLRSPGKTHERVPAEFDARFTRREKRFAKHNGTIRKLQEGRETADYQGGVGKSRATRSVRAAESLVNDVMEDIEHAQQAG
jgi:uncharacterized protein (UPF0332 family)